MRPRPPESPVQLYSRVPNDFRSRHSTIVQKRCRSAAECAESVCGPERGGGVEEDRGAEGGEGMTIVEETRQLHADIERCERGLVKCLKERDGLKRHKDLLWNEHRTGHLCQVIGERAAALRAVYDDADGARQGELQVFSGGGSSEKQFDAFYSRLGEIKGYYQRFPAQSLLNPAGEEGGDEETFPAPQEPQWTGEESWGRFLDLHTFN